MDVKVVWEDETGTFVATIFDRVHLTEAMGDRGYVQTGTLTRPGVRPELFGQPVFAGLLGPMWDNGDLRYESSRVYRVMSHG